MTVLTINNFSHVLTFKEKLKSWLLENFLLQEQALYTLFFSYGSAKERCKVWSSSDSEPQVLIKRVLKYIDQQFEKNRQLPEFLKFDIAVNVEEKNWSTVVDQVNRQPHNNHYRKGISFDEKFNICFLEQEVYGKALIKGVVYNQPNFFDEKNLNTAIKKKYPQIKTQFELAKIKKVWVFDTLSCFYENGQFIPLQSTGTANGVRYLIGDTKAHIKDVVLKNAKFLHDEIQADGSFIYGYFPAYANKIRSYNTVRHCTAVYALIETLEVEYNEAYLPKIKQAISYALETFYKEVDQKAFMIDGKEDDLEIKLGANAAAIFMLCKYQEVVGDSSYLVYAEELAKGIQFMVDQEGQTTHVLSYPSLEVKEKFRIVYYDGEAALGLLRLYQINQEQPLLDTVKLMFEHFIAKNYDRYHDHWLSYCTNELTKICPQAKYFEFGLNNYLKHMDFIRNRQTVYATFLEMMMSAYKMVTRLKEQGHSELFEKAKYEELKELIELRVEFQRNGFFYPEVAMYMAEPQQILNAFYVRHDRLRTRIDDQEHNLSGYVAYLNHFN
ncbi:poly alpha-glucosyltransferase [uncultured Acinetobacter sp.]|uniref:poly alpha-glucosyltransferase n=1 Tax=uncultured Acinetobacter sp. TaxID=165433 RepID=UPI0026264389|nr:poly alpha-glucosyltransferase [uncultured Acinetobacter sp.]